MNAIEKAEKLIESVKTIESAKAIVRRSRLQLKESIGLMKKEGFLWRSEYKYGQMNNSFLKDELLCERITNLIDERIIELESEEQMLDVKLHNYELQG